MKNRLYLVSILLILFLAGCSKKVSQESPDNYESIESTDRIHIEAQPVAINSLSDDEIKEKINSCENLKASEGFFTNIPESAPVLEFVARVGENKQDFEEYYKQFVEEFKYFFPECEMDENCLFYLGQNSTYENGLNLVKDYRDRLASGDEGEVELIYDENDQEAELTAWEMAAEMSFSTDIGYGAGTVYTGSLIKLGLNSDSFEYVGTYSPESKESFKLADKETAINEAVGFFENYINGMPYPEESNMKTTVGEVIVYKVNEDSYGYYFNVSSSYQGVIYDYGMPISHRFSDVDTFFASCRGDAFMAESNCMAFASSSFYRLQLMDDVVRYDGVYSLENAIKAASDELTSEVEFEVLKAEFVYLPIYFKDENNYVQMGDGIPRSTKPYWKFTMYNTNDGKNYDVYVSAKDGSDVKCAPYINVNIGGGEN